MAMGLALIVAIGAQNAFVLRQGLLGEHVFTVCLTCALSDAILITLGVTAFEEVTNWLPAIEPIARIAGALFLFVFGARSLWSALRSRRALHADERTVIGVTRPRLGRTLLACLAITWLNPHVYLDTVVMLGAISTQFEGARVVFASGAITGSFLFFFALGYGARPLRPLFERPAAWRILEAGIAVMVWTIAVGLLTGH